MSIKIAIVDDSNNVRWTTTLLVRPQPGDLLPDGADNMLEVVRVVLLPVQVPNDEDEPMSRTYKTPCALGVLVKSVPLDRYTYAVYQAAKAG